MPESFSEMCLRSCRKRPDGYPVDPRYVAIHPELRAAFYRFNMRTLRQNDVLFMNEAQGATLTNTTACDKPYLEILPRLPVLFDRYLVPGAKHRIFLTGTMERRVADINVMDIFNDDLVERQAEEVMMDAIVAANDLMRAFRLAQKFYESDHFRNVTSRPTGLARFMPRGRS